MIHALGSKGSERPRFGDLYTLSTFPSEYNNDDGLELRGPNRVQGLVWIIVIFAGKS